MRRLSLTCGSVLPREVPRHELWLALGTALQAVRFLGGVGPVERAHVMPCAEWQKKVVSMLGAK